MKALGLISGIGLLLAIEWLALYLRYSAVAVFITLGILIVAAIILTPNTESKGVKFYRALGVGAALGFAVSLCLLVFGVSWV